MAVVLLASALVLALFPRSRPLARWLALGVPGSFAGVFTFQLAALPLVGALAWTVLLPIGCFHGVLTTNPAVIALAIGTALVATVFFASASLAGFVTGWRAANAVAAGIGLREFLVSDWVCQRVATLLRRPYRLPLLTWLIVAWSVFAAAALRTWLYS